MQWKGAAAAANMEAAAVPQSHAQVGACALSGIAKLGTEGSTAAWGCCATCGQAVERWCSSSKIAAAAAADMCVGAVCVLASYAGQDGAAEAAAAAAAASAGTSMHAECVLQSNAVETWRSSSAATTPVGAWTLKECWDVCHPARQLLVVTQMSSAKAASSSSSSIRVVWCACAVRNVSCRTTTP